MFLVLPLAYWKWRGDNEKKQADLTHTDLLIKMYLIKICLQQEPYSTLVASFDLQLQTHNG